MPENEFVPGRMAMTCCAEDMTFLGFICKGDKKLIAPFSTRDWAKLTAKVKLEEREEYHGIGPVLHLEKIPEPEKSRTCEFLTISYRRINDIFLEISKKALRNYIIFVY